MNKSKIKVVDLFAGVGGFHLGLSRASNRYEVVWANQYEPSRKNQFAYNIYKKNFPKTPISNEDIRKINKDEIPKMDLLVAGFPCQDYSVATSGAKGIEGEKGALWWEVHEVLLIKKPNYILLENVDRLLASPGVRSNQPGRDFGIILRTLSDLGYGVSWKMINAADYGYPQRRRRTFIFAFRNETKFFDYVFNISREDIDEIEEFIKTMVPFSNTMSNELVAGIENVDLNLAESLEEFSKNFSLKKGFKKTGFMLDGKVFMADYQPEIREEKVIGDLLIKNINDEALYLSPEKIEKFKKQKMGFQKIKKSRKGYEYKYGMGSMQFPDPLDKPARTIVTSESTVSRMTHVVRDPGNNRLRVLSPIETERINTFPDNWTHLEDITNSNRYFTMGNALVVDLVKEIGKEMLKIIYYNRY
ncbi:DNA cytosine methyltransferase [Dialister micraerophilus]|uniref:Cytosine-specific methyltransferase n=1 Tax=Dialister micraerophilus DSM 19965 TaxID=888062 RepID=F2BXA6_9FIRM|nr:DNA (cytosine-5-)-methyltransferase [Dialister micraerophilus]EGF13725.1 DNA (cytosine-5-)-methyltransferase [Dialister micraerophilus DSM 19965]MDK8285862.1 DNA (cytosine-5-)-methyltransferase [Dialister micraerophilus]